MKSKDEILREFDEVLQYFIAYPDSSPKPEFSENVSKLINIKADLSIVLGKSEHKCLFFINDDYTKLICECGKEFIPKIT